MNNQEPVIKWQQVYSCSDGMEAQLVKNLMEINDIPVQLQNVIANAMFPDTSVADVRIWVPEEHVETAKKLIEENFE